MGGKSYSQTECFLGVLAGVLEGAQKKTPIDGGPWDWKAGGYAASAKSEVPSPRNSARLSSF